MYVLGTAGHVDHGKSVLVQALTGIDPDRLPEERVRGMTIDLGFAWLKLPSGREVSMVDVPGHERFIKNMLAGIGGIDMALLIVAADEGVMPQTREHLGILDLLRVERGIVVITKKDLVDPDWLELVTSDVEETLKGTNLQEAPILSVSAARGQGIPELALAIDGMIDATPSKKDICRPRLPIDRVFTISGFGTVVTGTLIDGDLSVGEEVEAVPAGRKARIRGLQTHKKKVDKAEPGSRTAANLTGISKDELTRGNVITRPGWLRAARILDAKLRLLPDAPHPIRHNASVSFYIGAAETEARVRLLDKELLSPGDTGWAQILLDAPVAVVKGDLFIVRSSKNTLGGGEVVDSHARRHRRFHGQTIENLEAREKGAPEEVIINTLEAHGPLDLSRLTVQSNLPSGDVKALLDSLLREDRVLMMGDKPSTALLFSREGWLRFRDRAVGIVQSYYKQFPLRITMPKEALRTRMKLTPQTFSNVLKRLFQEGALVEDDLAVRLAGRNVELTRAQRVAVDAYLASLAKNPYSPPGCLELDSELLNFMMEQRQIVRVSDNVTFAASAFDEMVERISDHINSQGKVGLAEVKDMFRTSRKYAVSLLEYLDRQGITRRVGDDRVLK